MTDYLYIAALAAMAAFGLVSFALCLGIVLRAGYFIIQIVDELADRALDKFKHKS